MSDMQPIQAVLWDFGGVILSSPFEAFARYEAAHGLSPGFIRGLNSRQPDTNAWACFERGDIDVDEFASRFEAEAHAAGGKLNGREVLRLIGGEIRPEMVEALDRVRARWRVACITNNMPVGLGPSMTRSVEHSAAIAAIMARFELVVESSKLGLRKPDPRIYAHTCSALGVSPQACVYLDDLGINLKPARAMGMRTIKVESAAQALSELQAMLGISDLQR